MAQVEHRPPTGNLILAIGIALRAVCFTFAKGFLSNRVELTSPLVSFDLVEDGVALLKEGISPYSGDSIHMQPLLIHLFALFSELPEYGTMAFFVGMDVLTACFLRKAAQKLVNDGSSNIPNIVVSCFLLNPVTIASCSVQSLSVLNNLLLAAFVHAFTSGYLISSSILLGSLGQMTLYHYILVGCIFLRFRKIGERVKSLAIIIFTFASLCFINFALNQFNWNFIEDSYLFMYYVDDVTPSCSIFWYFFTQVFEHFRFFYISVFQINLLVYLVPLYLTVRNDNNLHLIISMLLIAVFSPYPTLNDATIYMALLPTLYRYRNEPMRFILPISCAIVSCIVLMPIMWHMWIINGSGNANFYFAVTIIYNLAQVYLLGDLLFAYFRKEAVAVCGDYITEKTSFIFH